MTYTKWYCVPLTASLGEETAFLCEVGQRAVFLHRGYRRHPDGTIAWAHTARTFCSRMLVSASPAWYPAVRPQLNLAPVNWIALFMNYLQQQAGEGTEEHQDA